MILYRPVGLKELELIAAAKYRAFPPRLPHQPIFYPVLNFAYAGQIAKEWNTQDEASGYAGFVTRFEVEDSYIQQFKKVKVVGSETTHQELWIPAEELATFNQHIVNKIDIEAAYYGPTFGGEVDQGTNLPRDLVSAEASC